MNDTSFFSPNNYIFLPTKNNPKVALAIDNSKLSKNAFKLYNPFSSKAKLFKSVMEFSFVSLNLVFKPFMSVKKEKSAFINYLEAELGQELVVSLYFATIKDKIVLQLQSCDAKVIGYLKYPLNDIGLKHIQNEIMAFEILSEKKIIEPYKLSKKYEGKPFLLLHELDGIIDRVDEKNIDTLVNKFKRKEAFTLINHPRILSLKASLVKNDMTTYISKLDTICNNSTQEYKLTYEHGDFTPWNIVKVKDEYIPFDFEYFVEDGLEYFDIIKYYYQVGKLLEAKQSKELVAFISTNIHTEEIKELFSLFLIKEILRGKEENEPFEFEENMIKILEKL
jgi:hypothetical protein